MVSHLLHVVVEHLLVSDHCVLVADQPLSRRGVLPRDPTETRSRAAVLSEVVVHDPVEATVVSTNGLGVPLPEHVVEELLVLLLNGGCFLL